MFYRVVLVILTILICISVHGEDGPPYLLRIERSGNRGVLMDLPVHGGDQFFIHYIHSSDKTPVQDTFLIERDGRLVLIEEAFLWYGAGLEFQKQEGMKMIYDGKWTRVQLYRPLPELVIRVGRVANQTFTFGDRSFPLTHLAKPGEGLLFSLIPIRRENVQ